MQVEYLFSIVLVFFKLDSCLHEQNHYLLQLYPQILACRHRPKVISNCSRYPCNLNLVIYNHKIVYGYT